MIRDIRYITKISNELLDKKSNIIRLEKISGAAVGCGGTVIFRRRDDDGGDKLSELYVYVNYQGKNVGTIEWRRNDLDLKYSYSWAPDSELMVAIKEKETEDEAGDNNNSSSSCGDNNEDNHDGDELFLRGNLHVRIICAEDLPNTDR